MSGHYASADVERLLRLANLVLNRNETRTVLRVANGWPVERPPVDNGSRGGPAMTKRTWISRSKSLSHGAAGRNRTHDPLVRSLRGSAVRFGMSRAVTALISFTAPGHSVPEATAVGPVFAQVQLDVSPRVHMTPSVSLAAGRTEYAAFGPRRRSTAHLQSVVRVTCSMRISRHLMPSPASGRSACPA
jgi:hypothetical protein